MSHANFMREAFAEAFKGVAANRGGPFGAVIVLDGAIIGRGCNQVTSSNDPTAHAEVVAIREACKALGRFHLTNAVLYATCEPCPMCLSAVYWAQIKTVYYAADRHDAARIGFNDRLIYEELAKPPASRYVAMKRLPMPETRKLFDGWMEKTDKTLY